MRIVRVLVVSSVIAAAALTAPASAQSRICSALQAELAALGGGSGRSAGNQQRLERELDQLKAQARRARCRGGFFLFRNQSPACDALLARIDRLERQLAPSRRSFFDRRANNRQWERDRIRRAMAREGCSEQGRYEEARRSTGNRTICVRMCDGYYFPIDFSAPRQRLATDAERCLSMYPAGEAELYYYANGGDAADAVSLSGQRYGDQPFAFDYRKAYRPACAARLHQGLAALGTRVLAGLPKPVDAGVADEHPAVDVPIPIARADLAVDPETLANRSGGFVPRRAETATAVAGIRRVGEPVYFAATISGPPPTVPGYKPPEIRDFRVPQRATILPKIQPAETPG